jgi:hypothetical protein
MIVWSGKGILSIAVLLIVFVLCLAVLPKAQSDYAFVIAAFAAAAFSWFMGNKWNNQEARIVIDEKTGQRINLKSVHVLFWIKMQYWGIIFSIIGLVILAQKSIIAAIILAVFLSGIVYFIYSGKKGTNRTIDIEKEKKSKFQTEKNVEPAVFQVETEEERLRRRQEKEDPSRFMPK